MKQLGNQTKLATQLLNAASTLDLAIIRSKDVIKDIYYQLNQEDEQGYPRQPDIKGARTALIDMHQKNTQLRERSIRLLTGVMEDRSEELDMVYYDDDANNSKLMDRVAKAGVSEEGGKWIMRRVTGGRLAEGSNLL